jgi:hypothetical protein
MLFALLAAGNCVCSCTCEYCILLDAATCSLAVASMLQTNKKLSATKKSPKHKTVRKIISKTLNKKTQQQLQQNTPNLQVGSTVYTRANGYQHGSTVEEMLVWRGTILILNRKNASVLFLNGEICVLPFTELYYTEDAAAMNGKPVGK